MQFPHGGQPLAAFSKQEIHVWRMFPKVCFSLIIASYALEQTSSALKAIASKHGQAWVASSKGFCFDTRSFNEVIFALSFPASDAKRVLHRASHRKS
jgi:hypothetical protein